MQYLANDTDTEHTEKPPTTADSDAQLIDWLIQQGKLREPDRARAQRLAHETHESLAVLLIKLGAVSERDIAEGLSVVLQLPLIASANYPDIELFNGRWPIRFLKEFKVFPIHEDEHQLTVAMADPRDRYVHKALSLACGKSVIAQVGIPSEIEAALQRQSDQATHPSRADEHDHLREADVEQLKDMASEAPIIRLVNTLLQNAITSRASDIHIEPFETQLKVRYRIDGVLVDIDALPVQSAAAVISRVKLMARLNIAERRLPQDGRIQLRMQGRELDLRVSTVPTLYGESVVLRLLDRENLVLDFATLGFSDTVLERFMEILQRPHGIVLVTGPTGSGKSTTLYTALARLNTPERKIITAEDPVEYQLVGINQIAIKPQIGLTFAQALRSIVRQDPDVIMIGEMRDLETAQIAVQSALTGHLVLSTLHTNDAASSINRLLDMGIEDYLLTSTVNGIVAQRLVRKLCTNCREPYEATPEVIRQLRLPLAQDENPVLYRPVGCPACSQTGYRGRVALVEVLLMSEPLRRLLMRHATAQELQAQAIQEGMQPLYENGLHKVLAGITTLEEVLRVTQQA